MRKSPFLRTVRRFLGATANNSADPKTSVPMAKIGMVSRAEMDFYCESAAGYFGKKGAIVDLGCWMGATSIALARGILSHGSQAGHFGISFRYSLQLVTPEVPIPTTSDISNSPS